jgi:uncharacterized membrane protein YuzA (DUF378 family)
MSGGKGCLGCKLAGLLVVIGAINWGLVGAFQYNLVAALLGDMTTAARVVYSLVGIAGVLKLISCVKCCPCGSGSCATK